MLAKTADFVPQETLSSWSPDSIEELVLEHIREIFELLPATAAINSIIYRQS